MKVLYITHRSELGGGEISFIDIIKYIDKKIVEPYILVPDKGSFYSEICKLNFPVYTESFPCVSKFSLKTILNINRIVKTIGIDIIHCNTTRSVFYALPAAKLNGIKLIWHNRGTDKRGFFEYILGCLTDYMIAISESVSGYIENQGIYREKIKVIYNGIPETCSDSNKKTDLLRKEFDIPSGYIIIGLIGRFTKEKGHKYILDIMPDLKNKFNGKIKLVFIGGDNFGKSTLTDIKEHILKLKLEKDVIFTGYREDINQLITGLDCVVIPSEREAFGRVVLECWLNRVPAAAFAVEGLKELITDKLNGILVSPGNSQDLINKIEDSIKNTELRDKIVKNGREKVKQFDINKTVEKILKLYYDIHV